MAPAPKLNHFVVDGSNIATEGRSQPSLKQLNEAVLAFMAEHPGAIITVVVDATFGHRIEKKETAEFDAGVSNNELVTPPAGAVGRGDAFVLTIANKANAGVLSNDSFQEFHGDYDWLFDEGRLIGGKPVPHVGWVFVTRTPVRGPKSRRSIRESQDDSDSAGPSKPVRASRTRKSSNAAASRSASEPMPVPDAPPPKSSGPSAAKESVNELMPFLEFAEKHPVGTSCTGTVETYASHGAYVRVGDVVVYLPLRLMADPAPRSARTAVTLGDSVTVVIVGYVPDRRSIDGALPSMAKSVIDVSQPAADVEPDQAPVRKAAVKKVAAKKAVAKRVSAKKTSAQSTAAIKKPAIKKPASEKPAGKKAAGKKVAGKKMTDENSVGESSPSKKKAVSKRVARNGSVEASTAAKVAPTRAAQRKPAAKRAAPKRTAAKNVSKE
jgi:hypothetical protein